MATKAATQPPSPARAALAAAIGERESARKGLADARAASAKALDYCATAADALDALQAELDQAKASSADRLVAAVTADSGVMEVTRAEAALRDKLADAQQELAAWERARAAAEDAVKTRQSTFEWSCRKAEQTAREVLASEIGVAQLLEEAEEASRAILEKRAVLFALQALLPDGEARAAVLAFLRRPWLLNEPERAQQHPAAAPYRQRFAALLEDAAT